MDRLGERDLRAVLGFVRGAYACLAPLELKRYVVSTLPTLVRSDITSYNEVKSPYELVADPSPDAYPYVEEWFVANLPQLTHKHPILAYRARSRDGGAVKMSDFVTRRQFRRLELYNELFRPLGVEAEIGINLFMSAGVLAGIALQRGPDFSERDRLILNVLRPHLRQAAQNAEAVARTEARAALTSRALEKISAGIVLFGAGGRIRLASNRARRLLAAYFDAVRPPSELPGEMSAWILRRQTAAHGLDEGYQRSNVLVVEREGRRLTARWVADQQNGILILEEQVSADPTVAIRPADIKPLGLTFREGEVLVGVIRGQTNVEIGEALTLSARTVGKHLEHIFDKLGVSNRRAALARALEGATAR